MEYQEILSFVKRMKQVHLWDDKEIYDAETEQKEKQLTDNLIHFFHQEMKTYKPKLFTPKTQKKPNGN